MNDLFLNLNDDNAYDYAIANYEVKNFIEFETDYDRICYVNRLLGKFKRSGIIKDRLLLNHVIVLYNVFERVAITRLLFFRLGVKYYSELTTILIFLNLMPRIVKGIDGKDILFDTLEINPELLRILIES